MVWNVFNGHRNSPDFVALLKKGTIPANLTYAVDQHGRTRPAGEHETAACLSVGDVTSACTKLQSFGLVVQVRQNSMKVSRATLPFGPLKKGYDFLG